MLARHLYRKRLTEKGGAGAQPPTSTNGGRHQLYRKKCEKTNQREDFKHQSKKKQRRTSVTEWQPSRRGKGGEERREREREAKGTEGSRVVVVVTPKVV